MITNYKTESYMFGCVITCKLNHLTATQVNGIEDHNQISALETSFKKQFCYFYMQRFNEFITPPKVNFSGDNLIILINRQDIERRIEHGKFWNYDWRISLKDVIEKSLNATFAFNQNVSAKSK